MNKNVIIKAETFKVEEAVEGERKGIRISGMALPFGKKSRNGIIYNKESCIRTVEQWKGLPILFNHNEEKPIGHVIEAIIKEDGLYYVGDLDSEEEDIIRKIKRGDIRFVSIQAIVEKAEDSEEVEIKEWLELSVCTIPGFPETSIEIEKFVRESEKESKSEVEGENEDIAKEPFAGFKNWDECISTMKKYGYDDETAKKICGALKRDYEKEAKDKTPHFDMSACITRLSKVPGITDPAKVCMWLYKDWKAGNRKNPFPEFFEEGTKNEITSPYIGTKLTFSSNTNSYSFSPNTETQEKNINEKRNISMDEKAILEEIKKLREELEDKKEQENPDLEEIKKKLEEISAEIEAIKTRLAKLEEGEEGEEKEEGITNEKPAEIFSAEKLAEMLRGD